MLELNTRNSRLTLPNVLLTLTALVVASIFAFPIYFMVTTSFKAETEVFATPLHWLPHDFQGFQNYVRAFEMEPVARFLLNTTIVAVLDVSFTVFFSAVAGFGFAKYRFPGNRILFYVVISTMMIPVQILLVPLVTEIHHFGWTNTYIGLIVPGILNAFGVFMMRQFSHSIPDEILWAARIDGASEPRIFWRLGFPLLAPASGGLAIIIFVWAWNNFLWPLVVVQSKELTVLAVGLTAFSQPYEWLPMWTEAMAVSTLATLPVAMLFIFFQRFFVEGLTAAAIKG